MSLLETFQKESDTGSSASVLLDISGDVRDKIVDHVDSFEGSIDLCVMGSRGIKGSLKRIFMGSVSSYCLSYCNCPIVVVPPEVLTSAFPCLTAAC